MTLPARHPVRVIIVSRVEVSCQSVTPLIGCSHWRRRKRTNARAPARRAATLRPHRTRARENALLASHDASLPPRCSARGVVGLARASSRVT
jgi:hypothetical protein